MNDLHAAPAGSAQIATAPDSHAPACAASPKGAPFDVASLQKELFWTVPETAFLLRVSVRSVWRLLADPRSGFPKARRVGGRTVLARDEVLRFMRGGSG